MKILTAVRDTVWSACRDVVWPTVRDTAWPKCTVCSATCFRGSDKVAELRRLKPLGEVVVDDIHLGVPMRASAGELPGFEYKAAYDGYKHLCEQCWKKISTVQCDLCPASFDVFALNKAAELKRLKPLGEYEAAYDRYKHLCEQCWKNISTVQCDLCHTSFDVFALNNQLDNLKQNLEVYSVHLDEVAKARRVCQSCYEQRKHSRCDRCLKPFPTMGNAADVYRSSSEVPKWLAPYHKDYSQNWDHLCPSCYDECLASCQAVQTRLSQWIDGTRHERVFDFRTVKKLGRVEYDGTDCDDPAKLKERLQLYAVQLGGNAFVEFFSKTNAQRVIAGHGVAGNPFFKTVPSFTGYAFAVIVEPFEQRRPAPPLMADGALNVTHLVLDGLNICHWASQGEPDLRILLALALELTHRKLPFLTFFDANTPHVLGDGGSGSVYRKLIGDRSGIFVEVPGRMRADEFILQHANDDNDHVISNDQYRDFADRYPWVAAGDRLIKGVVAGDRILIPRLGLNIRINSDAVAVADVLVKTIALQSHEACREGG
jgi:hypothetical protein